MSNTDIPASAFSVTTPYGEAPTRPFCLLNHIYACRTNHHTVLLDARRSRYIGIDPMASRALERLVDGFPHFHDSPSSAQTSELNASTDAASLTDEMLSSGLIAPNRGAAIFSATLRFQNPTAALLDEYDDDNSGLRISIRDVLLFARCLLISKVILRYQSIESLISRVSSRAKNLPASVDRSKLKLATATYLKLRPLFLSAKAQCLLDSLVLSEFLSFHRQYPTFVIGVCTAPFGAHCWLQDGHIVVNDTPEKVRKFTPIVVL